jgi:hypothetical protein
MSGHDKSHCEEGLGHTESANIIIFFRENKRIVFPDEIILPNLVEGATFPKEA